MADENPGDDAPITFNIKSSNDAKYTITMPASATVTELKEKLSSKEFADLPVERQRLIYSGRVLKDADTLSTYKIQSGNTVHLVKGAASNQRQNAANQSTSAATAMPTNLSAGTGNNPLAGLTGARYAGFAQLPSQDMFGPDGGVSSCINKQDSLS
jgi:ubiquilin